MRVPQVHTGLLLGKFKSILVLTISKPNKQEYRKIFLHLCYVKDLVWLVLLEHFNRPDCAQNKGSFSLYAVVYLGIADVEALFSQDISPLTEVFKFTSPYLSGILKTMSVLSLSFWSWLILYGIHKQCSIGKKHDIWNYDLVIQTFI